MGFIRPSALRVPSRHGTLVRLVVQCFERLYAATATMLNADAIPKWLDEYCPFQDDAIAIRHTATKSRTRHESDTYEGTDRSR